MQEMQRKTARSGVPEIPGGKDPEVHHDDSGKMLLGVGLGMSNPLTPRVTDEKQVDSPLLVHPTNSATSKNIPLTKIQQP